MRGRSVLLKQVIDRQRLPEIQLQRLRQAAPDLVEPPVDQLHIVLDPGEGLPAKLRIADELLPAETFELRFRAVSRRPQESQLAHSPLRPLPDACAPSLRQRFHHAELAVGGYGGHDRRLSGGRRKDMPGSRCDGQQREKSPYDAGVMSHDSGSSYSCSRFSSMQSVTRVTRKMFATETLSGLSCGVCQ